MVSGKVPRNACPATTILYPLNRQELMDGAYIPEGTNSRIDVHIRVVQLRGLETLLLLNADTGCLAQLPTLMLSFII